MDLSAVIVNWNSGRHLSGLLASFGALMEEIEDVLVVDSASSDQSPNAAAQFPKVRLQRMETNLGFARAANLGVALTSTRFLLLLNPDLELDPDGVRNLFWEIENRPSAAIVSGQLRGSKGHLQREFQIRPLPTGWRVICDVLFLDELRTSLMRPFRTSRTSPPGSTVGKNGKLEGLEVEQPAAAFWLIRREAWEELGGFDEQFQPAWFEDVDFCKRALPTAWEVLHFPDCPVGVHRGGLALDRLGYRRFVEIYYSNLLRYLKKHHRTGYPFLWPAVQLGRWVRRSIIAHHR